MSEDEVEEGTNEGVVKLDELTAVELLRHVQRVFEMNPEKEDPWVEIYYTDHFDKLQFMRLWMRPSNNDNRTRH